MANVSIVFGKTSHRTTGGDLLIIGYANTLRCDDGVGTKVAEAIAALKLPGVRAQACHQLTLELAKPISRARKVVFSDADCKAKGDAKLHEIKAGDAGQILAHGSDPHSVLALAKQLFGGNPQARLLLISVEDFTFGDSLSPRAEAGFEAAVNRIQIFAQSVRDHQAFRSAGALDSSE